MAVVQLSYLKLDISGNNFIHLKKIILQTQRNTKPPCLRVEPSLESSTERKQLSRGFLNRRLK